jgi:hypothetical protein
MDLRDKQMPSSSDLVAFRVGAGYAEINGELGITAVDLACRG